MSYVNYIESDGKAVIINHYSEACYSKIFGRGCEKKTTELWLYQPGFNFTEEQVVQWVAMMNQLQFYITYLGKNSEEAKKFDIKGDYYWFYIDLSKYKHKNHLCSTLTIVRYLYETGYGHEPKVKAFFKIRETLPKIPLFKTLLMSFLYGYGGGHSCTTQYEIYSFITHDKLFAKFAESGSVYSSRSDIFSCWESGVPVKKFDITDNYKEIYKKLNTKEMINVFVVGGNNSYANWLPDTKLVKKLENADIVLFTGGEDVDPSLYGEPKHPFTSSNPLRDKMEKDIYEQATKLGKKKLGICRGSQFLCVMNGGKLVQHQENPEPVHPIKTLNWGEINITSTHHQAALPYPSIPKWQYKLLGWTEGISKIHQDGNQKEVGLHYNRECEIVYYVEGQSLGIQGHPEFLSYQKDPANKESLETLQTIFKNFVNNTL